MGEIYAKYKKLHAYDEASKLKEEGKIKHFEISFHDNADVLDMILTENPDIEVVQIQFNYVDYEDPAIQRKACYEVCRKYNKPVIVMEPVKGGNLVNLPKENGYILTPNHQGLFDVLLICDTHERPTSFVIRKDLEDVILLKQVIKALDAKALDRDDPRHTAARQGSREYCPLGQ